MEQREYAESIVLAETLEGKLSPPPASLTDAHPGQPWRIDRPGRPSNLHIFQDRVKVPRASGMSDRVQRARILHALANHELQAVELFAWAVLAFPDAPKPFRRGLIAILADEQRHMSLYIDRIEAHGGTFGDYPVTGHFWNRIGDVNTPLQFVCTMGLTFENANLDFAKDYADAARDAGDVATVAALQQVHDDEIRHVAFAWQWLRKLGGNDVPAWETYVGNIEWPLSPERARGKQFDRASREAAGMDREFIAQLESVTAQRPNGRPR